MLKIIEIFVCEKKTSKVTFKCITFMKKRQKRSQIRSESEKEREREKEKEVIKGFCEKNNQSSITHKGYLVKRTHQGLPSVSIPPKSMTCRDTVYLKSDQFQRARCEKQNLTNLSKFPIIYTTRTLQALILYILRPPLIALKYN